MKHPNTVARVNRGQSKSGRGFPAAQFGTIWPTTSPNPHNTAPVTILVGIGRASKCPSYHATNPPPPFLVVEVAELAGIVAVLAATGSLVAGVVNHRRCHSGINDDDDEEDGWNVVEWVAVVVGRSRRHGGTWDVNREEDWRTTVRSVLLQKLQINMAVGGVATSSFLVVVVVLPANPWFLAWRKSADENMIQKVENKSLWNSLESCEELGNTQEADCSQHRWSTLFSALLPCFNNVLPHWSWEQSKQWTLRYYNVVVSFCFRRYFGSGIKIRAIAPGRDVECQVIPFHFLHTAEKHKFNIAAYVVCSYFPIFWCTFYIPEFRLTELKETDSYEVFNSFLPIMQMGGQG